MAAREQVRLEEGRVARITLDRPPVNVLNLAMLGELAAALGAAGAARGTKVVLLAGAGKAFCAGVDVKDHTAERVESMIAAFARVIEAVRRVPVPVVCAVHGPALGGGCELAQACDVVLAREDAQFAQPEIRLGVFAPAAAVLLPRLIGRQRALDLLLTGRRVTAAEARELGLVARVLPAASFESGVAEYADSLARLSRPVLALCKRAVLENLERPLDAALAAADRLYLEELMALDDAHEGLAAFIEKRDPVWSEA
jgi:cyclohexa-1,5-dienecarbonyl-CoA hydratase